MTLSCDETNYCLVILQYFTVNIIIHLHVYARYRILKFCIYRSNHNKSFSFLVWNNNEIILPLQFSHCMNLLHFGITIFCSCALIDVGRTIPKTSKHISSSNHFKWLFWWKVSVTIGYCIVSQNGDIYIWGV